MKKNLFVCAASALFAIAFVFSCSDSDGGGSPIKKARITGVFQKGPFVKGTQATLNELNSNLSPTGRPYQTLITDDKGTFELKDVELVSPYAHLIATGFFQNEVTGSKSIAPITLQAIVDVTDKDNINVNVITHLEYYRVIDLVGGGMTVKAAKKQAQREIFAVFGIDSDGFKDSEDMTIFGESESDAALLAVSVLLLGDLGEADFTERIMDFSQGIRNNGGVWSNEEAKEAMADWAAGANFGNIKNNILSWGLFSGVPEFEKYANDYWVAKNTFAVDERDGKIYKFVKIGEQTWMAKNLNYYNENGSVCYEYNNSYCAKYGRLYNWEAAMSACPAGWHLPSNAEWDVLSNYVGGNDVAGKHLKATSGWNDNEEGRSGNGEDKYGFSALPGGIGLGSYAHYLIGYDGRWWSSSEDDSYSAGIMKMSYDSERTRLDSFAKRDFFSVRCIKNVD